MIKKHPRRLGTIHLYCSEVRLIQGYYKGEWSDGLWEVQVGGSFIVEADEDTESDYGWDTETGGRNALEMWNCRVSGNVDCTWKIETKDKSYEEWKRKY